MFIGFNLGFFPMHLTGLLGHAAAHLHLSGRAWAGTRLNLITTLGAFVFALGVLLFLDQRRASACAAARVAGANPWDAPTLEWSIASPPPPYNFAVIPTVASRHPLWEDRLRRERRAHRASTTGCVLDHGRETLGTTPLDAEPDVILQMPGTRSRRSCSTLGAVGRASSALLLHCWWLAAVGGAGRALALHRLAVAGARARRRPRRPRHG